MKTIQSFFNLLLFFLVAGFFFAGCYTRMETMKDEESSGSDNGDYAYADSSGASNDTTGNNYFSDDDYRSSQYRTAFDYYSPSPYGWGVGLYPWYADYNYPWDATLVYPYPYWYGGYPYYGWGWGFGFGYGYGYGHYYNGGYHRGGGIFAGRLRTIGSTRGGESFLRTRNGAGIPGTVPVARGAGSSRTPAAPEVTASNTSRMRSRGEVPWWQRGKATTENSPARNGLAERTQSAGRNVSMVNRARNVRTPSNYRGRTQPGRATRSGPQSRQASPHYSSPPRTSGRSSSGGGSRGGGGGSRGGGGGSKGR